MHSPDRTTSRGDSRSGERGINSAADQFRWLLEDLAEAWAATGVRSGLVASTAEKPDGVLCKGPGTTKENIGSFKLVWKGDLV